VGDAETDTANTERESFTATVATSPSPQSRSFLAASPSITMPTPLTTGISTAKRAQDYPDNLANIKGIGEAYKRRLYATGIYTWRQLAESDTDSLRHITRAKPNADIRSWQTQARELAEKHNRWDADFTGPLDDFTRIEGIGAITADILYKVGICVYEQLSATSTDELAHIVPAPTVGNENDFDGWRREATQLASAKQRNGGRLP
jgi:predicted flap endonuclease-1-like 5' DNA nuclease